MPLIADYAITPDVLDETSYSDADSCAARIETIREAMMTEGIVRDLRDGCWRNLFRSRHRAWHRRGTELVKKLATQGRLVGFPPALSRVPVDDLDWCAEALETHAKRKLTGGVIVTNRVKREFSQTHLVSRIDRLSGAPWWAARGTSVKLARTLFDYQKQLDLILRFSTSILFIDPHLDPMKHQYRDIGELLSGSGGRTPAPTIEIHRVCYEGSGESRRFPMRDVCQNYFQDRFSRALGPSFRTAGLRADVFVWDDFHDRFLISNLIGISLPNGFDTGGAYEHTRWTRLSRSDRDDIQREFDPISRQHRLHVRFSIP